MKAIEDPCANPSMAFFAVLASNFSILIEFEQLMRFVNKFLISVSENAIDRFFE